MPDYNFHTEPVMSGESEKEYKERIKNKAFQGYYSREFSRIRRILYAFYPEFNPVKQPTVMKNETITIEAPEGHVIDKENSTDTVIRFKKVESKKSPMSFDELKKVEGYYISAFSDILEVELQTADTTTQNTWPTKKLAEAALALSQLLQLRDAWNECNTEEVAGGIVWYGITNQNGKAVGMGSNYINMPLRFKTEVTRDAFLEQFRPLIETALPFL